MTGLKEVAVEMDDFNEFISFKGDSFDVWGFPLETFKSLVGDLSVDATALGSSC